MERKKKMRKRIGGIAFLGLVVLGVAYGYRVGWRIELTKVDKNSQMASMEHSGEEKVKDHTGHSIPTGQGHEGHTMPKTPSVYKAKKERKILYWVDPMHPSFKSDKPGKAPDCGMDLVPVYAEEEVETEKMPPGTVRIDPKKQQLIGVKTGSVEYRHMAKTIRAVGQVVYDETTIRHIHTKVQGWVEKLFVDYTGKMVTKGQPLFTIYSPELVSTQEEYLLSLKAGKYLQSSPIPEVAAGAETLKESTKRRLYLWDITEEQIQRLQDKGEVQKTLTFYSPIKGFVLNKEVYEGKFISPEMQLITIADLSTVWIMADIYEYELPLVKLGQGATISFPYFAGEVFTGKVAYIYPYLESQTRTAKVRLEFPNPEWKLKPGMYANVEIKMDLGEMVAVPEDAVIDTGQRQVVFIDRGNGYFEARKIKAGIKVEGYYEILSGLSPGEKVLTSANFLIDSESQLKAAMSAMGHQH